MIPFIHFFLWLVVDQNNNYVNDLIETFHLKLKTFVWLSSFPFQHFMSFSRNPELLPQTQITRKTMSYCKVVVWGWSVYTAGEKTICHSHMAVNEEWS